MKKLWKHITHYLPNKIFAQYLLLGLIAVFSEDVISHANSPMIAHKLMEKEKGETEKELSEESENEQSIVGTGKFKKIKTQPHSEVVAYTSVLPTPTTQRFVCGILAVALPTGEIEQFIHTPRYICYRSILI
jgi:hypothetical protein